MYFASDIMTILLMFHPRP